MVAVGGDGTVNEIVNGLVGTDRSLGIIPAGSGNDLSKSINLPTKLHEAIEVLLIGKVRPIDVGKVSCYGNTGLPLSAGNHHERYFVNGVGVGFDAAVAERTQTIKYLSGTVLYAMAVFQTIGRYKAPKFEISIDGKSRSSKYLLIAIGNGKCAGGGFYLTPEAKVDDGVLDLCLIDEMSVPRILNLMPRVMRGKHRGFGGVAFSRGRMIGIRSEDSFFVHGDGEMVGRHVNRVEIGLMDKVLNVIVG